MNSLSNFFCEIHKKVCNGYCLDCEENICPKCEIKLHLNHETKAFNNNEILEFKKEYINNPDYCVDLSNKDEFIEVMRDYFYKDEEYPIFVKAGAIIPMSLDFGNSTKAPKNMEIQVFPGANNSYSIYEDDGETSKYLNGEYLITNVEFIYKKDNYKLTILPVSGKKGIIPDTRNYRIRFKNTKPTSVISTFVGSTRVNNNCYKDDTDLIVELKEAPTSSQVTIVCSGNDIEIDAKRIINEDIVSIISDLPIKTIIKQKIDDIFFSNNMELKKKRIAIRKLANGKNYIDRKYIQLLLKLLEYINEV